MNKISKGVVAAGAGAVLLLGGGGTLAYWSETPTVPGGAINAGHMNLVPIGPEGGCYPWQLDSAESDPVVYSPGDPIVPGDVLTRDCAYQVEAEGNHLRANVVIGTPVFNGEYPNFRNTLSVGVSDVVIGGETKATFTELDDGESLTARVTVTFNRNAGNDTEDLETVLENATLTATQVHG